MRNKKEKERKKEERVRVRRPETYSLANKVIPSFKLSLSLSLCISSFSASSLARKRPAERNINQASMGGTSEPASGNVRSIGLKAFSLHEMLSNGLPPRRPADAIVNRPSRLPHMNLHKASVEHWCSLSYFSRVCFSKIDREFVPRVTWQIMTPWEYSWMMGFVRMVGDPSYFREKMYSRILWRYLKLLECRRKNSVIKKIKNLLDKMLWRF